VQPAAEKYLALTTLSNERVRLVTIYL